MNATLYPLAALFAWMVVLSSAKHLAAIRKEPTRLATWYLYVCFALIFTVSWAGVWDRIDAWTGLRGSNALISMCFVMCYTASQLALLQVWSYAPDRARRRVRVTIAAVAVVVAVMIALFIRSDSMHALQQSFKAHRLQQSFSEWYGASAAYEAYLLIYLLTFTIGEVEVIRLCRRYAKVVSPSWLRTGLITTSIGATFGLLYSITRLADIVVARAKVDIGPWENVAEVSAGLGALLVMGGLTLHWWGPRISGLAQRLRRLVAYIRLHALWMSFYELDASIAFDDQLATGSGSVLGRIRAAARVLSDVEYYVARRVVEIRDGILTLRQYLDPVNAERLRAHFVGRGFVGDDLDAAVTAAQIRAALEAGEAATHNDNPLPRTAGNIPANLDAELAWLLRVTKYFTEQSTAPAHELAEADPTPTGGIA
ncbi:hypothetical protein ABIA35_008105 [Catenulispora sp. MAP12-49]|uniref:MAB_1171c family putative transporter n=1 Tax=Catenulispora sp. MAP12-49 TaxID=3156302 RepID=UPI0035152771